MPLLAVSKALGLPDPVVRIAKPCWLFAETIHLAGITGLLVYRSTWLRDTSPMYSMVADLMCRAKAIQVLVQETIEDEGMIHGSAEVMFVLLHPTDAPINPTDPGVRTLIRLCESFVGGVVHPLDVADELVRRLGLDRVLER